MKFYLCEKCGNLVCAVQESGVPLICCGQKMVELVPGTSDGAAEKHIPVVTVQGCTVTVTVGSVAHPMTPEHAITWIALETARGAQRKALPPSGAPTATFALTQDDRPIAAYAYCNLHGLWKAEIPSA